MSFIRDQACPKRNGRYYNPYVNDAKRSLRDVLLWQLGFFKEVLDNPVPKDFIYPSPEKELDQELPTVTWINHTTFLIKVGGLSILTDPIWSKRCSPFRLVGPQRQHRAPISLRQLPKIDFVLLSHDHYDHLDKTTIFQLQRANPEIIWVVPEGVKKWFQNFGITNVHEFAWWWQQSFVKKDLDVKVTAVPAQHFSGRSGFDYNKTLWAGYVVEIQGLEKRFYFVGDTGYNEYDFNLIGKTWPSMDLSLIPIGAYMPRKFMSPVHIDPYDAVKIHQEVGSKLSLSSHWKTFSLSDEPEYQPPYDLFLALKKQKIDPLQFLAVEPGTSINW